MFRIVQLPVMENHSLDVSFESLEPTYLILGVGRKDILKQEDYECVCAYYPGNQEVSFIYSMKRHNSWRVAMQFITNIDQLMAVAPKLSLLPRRYVFWDLECTITCDSLLIHAALIKRHRTVDSLNNWMTCQRTQKALLSEMSSGIGGPWKFERPPGYEQVKTRHSGSR